MCFLCQLSSGTKDCENLRVRLACKWKPLSNQCGLSTPIQNSFLTQTTDWTSSKPNSNSWNIWLANVLKIQHKTSSLVFSAVKSSWVTWTKFCTWSEGIWIPTWTCHLRNDRGRVLTSPHPLRPMSDCDDERHSEPTMHGRSKVFSLIQKKAFFFSFNRE